MALALAGFACRPASPAVQSPPTPAAAPAPDVSAPQAPPVVAAPADACDAPCADDRECSVEVAPDCSACVPVRAGRASDARCVARGCRANVCDVTAFRARCDRATGRCVLLPSR